MWKLHAYDDKTREWSEIGQFQSLRDAARGISKLEHDPHGAPRGGLFFRFYIDPLSEQSDAEILSHLEYRAEKGRYVLKRAMQ
jgi:hypothetical protein